MRQIMKKYGPIVLVASVVIPSFLLGSMALANDGSSESVQKFARWACERGVSDRQIDLAIRSLGKGHTIALADFGKDPRSERLSVFDLKTGKITSVRTTHGIGNGDQFHFEKFDDRPNSRAVMAGVFRTNSPYRGRDGKMSLRLESIDDTRKMAELRGLTVGSCGMISQQLDTSDLPKRSWGALCLPARKNQELTHQMNDGILISFSSRESERTSGCDHLASAVGGRDETSFERSEKVVSEGMTQPEIDGRE